jgi:cell division septal protein FtsQ
LDEQGRGILQAWLLAADGTVMMPVDPKYCASKDAPVPENLPALTGVRPNELRLGRAVEAGRVQAALSFLQCFNRSGLGARIQLSSVELNQSGVLVVATRDGARVTVAQGAFERQLARWRAIYEQGVRLGKRIQTVDLAVENNVPVRWADAGETAGPVSVR